MKQYELLYIVPSQYTEKEVGGIQKEVSALLEKKGAKVLRDEMVGKIRLAYPVSGIYVGSYVLNIFEMDSKNVKEFTRSLSLVDGVLRSTIVNATSDAVSKKVELTAYVAPLSEEAKEGKKEKPFVKEEVKVEEIEEKPVHLQPKEETGLSVEELDKKLDAILDDQFSDKV